MATVRDLLTRKANVRPDVLTVHPAATVMEAVQLMVDHGIGGLPVVDADGALVGIFTERDLLRRVVAERRDVTGTDVESVMTRGVVVGGLATPIDECAALMTARRLRHLPIVDDARLVGMLTIGDILATQVDEQQVTITELHRYVFDLR